MDTNILHPCRLMPKKFAESKPALFISPEQKVTWGIKPSLQSILVKVGHKKVSAQLVTIPQPFQLLQCSPDLLAALGLFPGVKLNPLPARGNTLCLGPLVAVLLSDIFWNSLRDGNGIKELTVPEMWAREMGCLVYFFSVNEVLWNYHLLKGTYYHPLNLRWETKWMPFPDVVYDEATFRHSRTYLNRAKYILKKFRQCEGLQVINHRRYFGKWEAVCCLNFFRDTRQFVPDSVMVNGPEDLAQMLDKWDFIYVKAEYGSYGYQVARVRKEPEGFSCQFGGHSQEQVNLPHLADIYTLIKERYGETIVMAQQGIELAEFDGRKFDFRVIMQRDAAGQWVNTLVSLRLAPQGSAVTNISSGGDEIVIEKEIFSQRIKNLTWNQLEHCALQCVTALESHYGIHGVIGLDLGQDISGRLWLFEANSKPSTMDYLSLIKEENAYRLYMQPFLYARYLFNRLNEGDLPLNYVNNHQQSAVIPLSSSFCRHMNIPEHRPIFIRAGLSEGMALVEVEPAGNDKIDLQALAHFFNLPEPVQWEITFSEDTLCLGPVTGLITNHDLFLKPEVLADITAPLDEQPKGLLYACSPDDIDLANGRVAGYQLIKDEQGWRWAPGLFPIMDNIVYEPSQGQ
ncbi:MAG: YheC/YheD family endospore coat-associated protein [Thermincolia bacterium]